MSEKLRKSTIIQDHDRFIEAAAFLAILRTHEVHMTRVAQFFKKHGLSNQQYNALRIIWARAGEEGIASLAIAQRLINRVPDITRLLDRLERNGWVTRQRSKEDRRVVLVRLTEEGLRLLEEVDAPLIQMQKEAFNHMGQEELESMIALLQRARQIPGVTI